MIRRAVGSILRLSCPNLVLIFEPDLAASSTPVRVYGGASPLGSKGTCSLTQPDKSCFSLSKSPKRVLASIMQSLSAN
jgi:hypothetical protein